jgi:hypothetical protein
MTWQSYKDDDNCMRCIMSVPGWKPKLPMTRWQKGKVKIYGRFQKLLQRMK